MINDDPSVIDPALTALKQTFLTQKTKSIPYRKQQLAALLKGLVALEQEFHDALKKDLGVTAAHSQMTSTIITKVDVEHNLKHVATWSKPINVDTPFVVGPGKSRIVHEPLGVVLVLSAWNYPLYTAIPPLAAAIAAGNCAILKPSELAPHSSNVLTKLIKQYLDPSAYQCIEGGVQVAIQITQKPFDLIIFTGSPEKGKLVAKAASSNLTPCILELGGKSPTIVDEGAKLEMSAQRIVQGRFMNAGQTCVACDYVLAHEKIVQQLINALKVEIKRFYGQNPKNSQDYSRIVTQQHTSRLQELLTNHQGQVITGGTVDVDQKYVEPTIILNPDLQSKVMNEEIFGPILPIITFKDFKETIKFINDRPKPLALYYFGNNSSHKDLVEKSTSSGAIVFNDSVFHLLNPNLPFGGVGNSGYSAYHGITGFKNCSHAKSIFDKSTINIYPFNIRYPPMTPSKIRTLNLFFKFSEVSERAVQRGVILVLLLVGAKIGYNKGYLRTILQKTKPFIDQLYAKANL